MNFKISSSGPVSRLFLEKGITDFENACAFVQALAYGRNSRKDEVAIVLAENCGTCSTKHALLKRLAEENGFNEIKLILGMYRINALNTLPVARILKRHGLTYLPEAHNYLKLGDDIMDYTKPGFSITDFKEDILEEREIGVEEIAEFKIRYHRDYLAQWLASQSEVHFSLEEIWAIREECIAELGSAKV